MFSSAPILIVEDDGFIAMDLADAVTDGCGIVVGPVPSVKAAMDLLDRRTVAGAVLDGRLTDRDITPVALRLAAAGIPLVIYSGTGIPSAVADRWPMLPVLAKPICAHAVIRHLWDEMQRMAGSLH